jgi:imidazolonepropionase-like amidohydrolase
MTPLNTTLAVITITLLTAAVVGAQTNQTAPRTGVIRPQPPQGKGTMVIKAARLIDGSGRAPIERAIIVITDNKITAVGSQSTVSEPSGAKVVDLGNVTLLPGFVDAHTHLIGRVLGDPEAETSSVRDYESFGAILGVVHAREQLMAGFTSVRNVGASGRFDDIALRKAINEGWVPGPRMQTAGHSLGITGGHCDNNGLRPGLLVRSVEDGIANGPEEIRASVRYQVKYGADVIKTCATGGVLSEGDAVGVTQYTFEEMKALVDEATILERKVAAHAHGTEGIKIAVRAGVASIEHGSFLDDEGARMMAERGTFLVPTLMAGEAVERAAKAGTLRGLRAEKALAAAAAMRKGIKVAVANKVPIALGTDAGVFPHGTNAREFQLLVEWGGLTPMQAIVAGTSNAAKLLGWDDKVGLLTTGKLADIIAVEGDPLKDISNLQKTIFVMKDGVVYKQP